MSEIDPTPSRTEGRVGFLSGLLTAIVSRGRDLMHGRDDAASSLRPTGDAKALIRLCVTLLESDGEASRVALAADILSRWRAMGEGVRLQFLVALADGFAPDRDRLDKAIDAYRANPNVKTLSELQAAAEPPRREVLRRLNLAPQGTEALVRMREALFAGKAQHPVLEALDADFVHLFVSWFNRGFLVLQRIDWTSPANILEKIIRYEAVHEIRDWSDLRLRLEPSDRRCFAFFHPQMVDEPLIFVEVALARDIPGDISSLLAEDREPIEASRAKTAVFYSISNCQKGLAGIAFGDFLIKQVVEELQKALPGLTTFVTLSPVPGFAAWLKQQRALGDEGLLDDAQRRGLAELDQPEWWTDEALSAQLRPCLLSAAAVYFVKAKASSGKPVDPVARFHLGNGAALHQLNFLGDRSDRGLQQSHGLMVNYLYRLADIETNHERFVTRGEVATSAAVRQWLRTKSKPARAASKSTKVRTQG